MAEPIPLELSDATLLRLIKATAADSKNVFLSKHARTRMKERQISRAQVEYCLRNGVIDEPAHVNIRGNWQCRLQCVHAGDWIRVAATLEKKDTGKWIVVLTVF